MTADTLHKFETTPIRPSKTYLRPQRTSAGEYVHSVDSRHFESAQIPPAFWRAPLSKFVAKSTLRTLKQYEDNLWDYSVRGMGAYFFGPAGSGKSSAAGRIAEVAMRKGFSVLWVTTHEIVQHLMTSVGSELDEALTSRNLIIIDGFRFSNPKTDAPVCDWIQMRAKYGQPTIMTSRVTVREHKNGRTDLLPLLEHDLFPLYFPKSK